MIKIFKYLVPNGYAAIALYPFIIFKKKEYVTPSRVRHERTHLKQQLELLIVLFYLWYVIEFGIKYLIYKDWTTAYYNISFEREAYKHQDYEEYLKKRKCYSFLKYL